MREIVLDTETTGLDPKLGDRIVEIAGIELVNSIATGRHYHVYINPERDMPEGAFKVHGLSAAFLADHPVFALHAEAFLDFVEGARLVIHNAEFDMRFLNHELSTLGRPPIQMERVVDTLAMARRRHPVRRTRSMRSAPATGSTPRSGSSMARWSTSNSWPEVYAELCGGRQTSLGLAMRRSGGRNVAAARSVRPRRCRRR